MATIFQTNSMGEAHVRVAIVTDRGNADLLVHRVTSIGMARGDAFWFITKNPIEAACKIFFTSVGFAYVKICFVDSFGEAGWQKPHIFKGRFKN